MSAWDVIAATAADEFSDIGDLDDLTRVALRLVVAALLGGMLGMEREYTRKAAGLRTHMLVSLGSALFVLVALEAGVDVDGLSRVVQGVVAGIGFLCAGAIIKSTQNEAVHGLTTSAGLWMASAIGLAAGVGREALAVLSMLLALGILMLEGRVRRWMRREPGEH